MPSFRGPNEAKEDSAAPANPDDLQVLVRVEAEKLWAPDKKQLRFNEIIQTALTHYAADAAEGVKELVKACDKIGFVHAGRVVWIDGEFADEQGPFVENNPLYVPKRPMWKTLQEQYGWLLA